MIFSSIATRRYSSSIWNRPAPQYKSVVEVFQQALKQEQDNSERIDAIFQLALEQRAFASLVELQWFITEQVEEEKSARENLAKVKMVSNDPAAILEFDRVLGQRELLLDNMPK